MHPDNINYLFTLHQCFDVTITKDLDAIEWIVPVGPVGTDIKDQVVRSRVSRVLKQVQQLRNRTKISRLGNYSTERREIINHYCQSTSLLWVLLVCVTTPLPALLLGLLLECIPLDNPAAGWKANYGVWIRQCLPYLSCIWVTLPDSRYHPGTVILQNFLYWDWAGCGATLTLLLLAVVWVFTLPFGIVITSFPFQINFATLLMGSLRRDRSTLLPRHSVALKYKLYLILAQSLLAFFYVTLSIIFTRFTSRQQFGLLLFLPVMKLAFKHLVAWLASENKETIPAMVVFTVDVCNGLYVSTCIQLSRSWWSSFLVIALNVVRTIDLLWDVNRGAKSLTTLDNLSRESKISGQSLKRSSRNRRQSVSLFQTASCSSELQIPTTIHTVQRPQKHRQLGSTITSYETKLNLRLRKMLFHLEYLVLVEYIETIIPTLYVIYLSVLIHLPSAKYYPHTNNLTTLQLRTSIESIILYALVEMLSIIWLHVVLRHKFGFSLLYQLAFVLETEKELLQGRLFVWITPLLQITLVHFGRDFSFQFKWLDSSPEYLH